MHVGDQMATFLIEETKIKRCTCRGISYYGAFLTVEQRLPTSNKWSSLPLFVLAVAVTHILPLHRLACK